MRFFRPSSRALSHLLRHDPVHHYTSPVSLFSRHSPFAPFSPAFEPFFSSPFSSPLYTVYEVREDDNNNSNQATSSSKTDNNKQEEVKTAEPQQQQQQQQAQSNGNQLSRHEDSHRQRWLDRRSRRHRHHHSHHPLSLFDSLLASSPFFSHAQSFAQPLEISVDLYSTPSAYQVNAAIPGVRKEDIKLTVEDGVLTIEAERREERGRPVKTTAAPSTTASTPAPSTSTAASTDATTQASQAEQKTVEVEVKADGGVETKPTAAPDTNTQQPQQQQQQQHQAQQHEAEQDDDDDVSVHHVESYYGRVQRSLALPEDVNVDELTARYEDGVLRIELPRIEEKKQQAKQINIQ